MANQQGQPHLTSEEEYFRTLDRELIAKKRAELDQQRAKQREQEQQEMHWLRCPKCGSEMHVVEMASIKVEKCEKCHGIFFNENEFEILMKSQYPGGMLRHMGKTLWRKISY